MHKPRAAQRRLVLGTSDSGKSYWSKRFVDRLGPGELVLIWDPESEWAGPIAKDGIAHAVCFHSLAQLTAWILTHNPRLDGRRLVVQVSGRAQFTELARIAFRAGDLWLVVDEAHSWCSAHKCPEAMLDLVKRCRHRRVSLLLISQRPAGLHPDIRNVKSAVTLFQMPDLLSRQWVRNEISPELELALRKLPLQAYLEWSGGTTWRSSSSRRQAGPSSPSMQVPPPSPGSSSARPRRAARR